MGNIEKFLYWSIGLLVTLAIISTGILLWNTTKPIMTAANREAADQARQISDAQFAAFDNQIVSGANVITAYRKYSGKQAFYLRIDNDASEFGVSLNGGETQCQATNPSGFDCYVSLEDILDISDAAHYVPPQAKFDARLLRDANERVYGIRFDRR